MEVLYKPSLLRGQTSISFLIKICATKADVTRCNDVVRQVASRLQHVTCPLCNLSRNFSGLAIIIAQSKLALNVAIKSFNLQSIQNQFHGIVAESRTELYFVQSLQAKKSRETSYK